MFVHYSQSVVNRCDFNHGDCHSLPIGRAPVMTRKDSTPPKQQMDEFVGIPLKTRIIRNELTGEYSIQFQRYGNKHRGFTLPITKEQIEKLNWWY